MHKSLFLIFIIFFCGLFRNINAQIKEGFNDGDFTNNPTWTGSGGSWIINSDNQLQSNDTTKNGTYYLSTPSLLSTPAQWEFYVKLGFNTSSVNYVDAYLTATAGNLPSDNTVGYFVRIGNTEDEISLYRKDSGGKIVKIIDGLNNSLTGNNAIKIKVICSADQRWTLFRDLTGTGYISEGTTLDSTYTTSAFFGFYIKQSTSSFFKKHFLDDIEVKPYAPDTIPPAVVSVKAVTNKSADVLFTEAVDSASAQAVSNYFVDDVGNPVVADLDGGNNALVHLTFATAFGNSPIQTLTVSSVKDLSGNVLLKSKTNFSFYAAKQFDVIIDEILSDPTPVVGLPNAEFIEIKNTSGKDISIEDWKLKSLSTTSAPFPSYTLPADSFLIITGINNVDSFKAFGKVLGISLFPSLNNEGTSLSLMSNEGIILHSITYDKRWFQNDTKSGGGWTLEMIDTKNPCTGTGNWKASTDTKGGTPGVKNSVDGENPDHISPELLRAAAIDSATIILTFSEPIDVVKASDIANYNITNEINPLTAAVIAPSNTKVRLTLDKFIVKDKVYTITANNITDCSGNEIQAIKTAKVALASSPGTSDIVINEILFNPKPGSVDYVEIYNRSTKTFDLKDLFIANRSPTTNSLRDVIELTNENILIFPGDFFVISEDGSIVKQNYYAKNPGNFIDIKMPSFPNDEGTVVLMSRSGVLIDELKYNSRWHFALINNEKGISLERIDYNKPTQSKDNWTSAASTSGYGTPSYQNSQFRSDLSPRAQISVEPKTFSPDKDGFEDYTTIYYQMDEPGFVANISIFDASGRRVKYLAKNATLALSGSFTWDGSDDRLNKVAVGIYVIYTEVFNLNGKTRSFKNAVIVAAKL